MRRSFTIFSMKMRTCSPFQSRAAFQLFPVEVFWKTLFFRFCAGNIRKRLPYTAWGEALPGLYCSPVLRGLGQP